MDDAAAGFLEYRSRAARATVIGIATFLIGGALIPLTGAFGASISIFGALASVFGAVGLIRVRRVRRIASAQGWRQRKVRFRVVGGGNGQPALLLEADDHEPEAILSVATTVFRWNVLARVNTLWVTGDPPKSVRCDRDA